MPEKSAKTDRRTRYTRQTIKETFLKLLNKKAYPKITVTEICRLAEINRGTFYLHYYDVNDVLDDILTEMLDHTTSAIDHVLCPKGMPSGCTYPFCDNIHSNEHYRSLFLDDTVSPRIIEKAADVYKENYVTWLMSHSLLTFQEAEALFYFQINGCLTINKLTLRNHCDDWKKSRRLRMRLLKRGWKAF